MSRLASGFARALAVALLGGSLNCVAAETTLKVETVFPRKHTYNNPVFEMLEEVTGTGQPRGIVRQQRHSEGNQGDRWLG